MKVEITLEKPHAGQQKIIDNITRFNAVECGRRFGKTSMGQSIAIQSAIDGKYVGWFAPTYKFLAEPWKNIKEILHDLIKTKNEVEKKIVLITGGVIDFWTLDNSDSGRSRKYHRVIIDEASIVPDLEVAWEQAIRPTLVDFKGDAFFLGTPKGHNYFHKLFMKGEQHEKDWSSWRMGTIDNPFIPKEEIEDARNSLPIEVFNQEFLGIPAENGGNPFGGREVIAKCIRPISTKKAVIYGVDLGETHDYTVVIGLDEDNCVCFFERWLKPWTETKVKLISILDKTRAIIDQTGVGKPLIEELQTVLPYVEGYHFTQQSKQQLMVGLMSAINQQLIFYPDGQIVSELNSYEYEYTATGITYTCPSGLYDDCVCSLALATRGIMAKPQKTFFVPSAKGQPAPVVKDKKIDDNWKRKNDWAFANND